MIGVSNPNMTFLPARIAVKKGFFGEEGLEAEVIRMRVKVFSPDGSIPLDGLRLVIEQAKREAGITRDIPFSEVADLTFVREAQRELGLKVR